MSFNILGMNEWTDSVEDSVVCRWFVILIVWWWEVGWGGGLVH